MRFGSRSKLVLAALGAAIAGAVAWACADSGEQPTWALAKPDHDPGGGAAMLLPSNDTRINLYLLLADRRGTPVRDPAAKAEGPPLVLFPWKVMSDRAAPDGTTGLVSASRCQSNAGGAADFTAAVTASRALPEPEKQLLIAARRGLGADAKPVAEYSADVECQVGALTPAAMAAIQSAVGREFAAYLKGAQLFYAGEFDPAAAQFGALGGASDPWVREAAAYMVARSRLNRALAASMTDYGTLAEAAKRDRKGAAEAASSFQSYLAAFPAGRYAGSARGLLRRAHWVGGDAGALAAEYGAQVSARAPLPSAAAAIELANEVDNKLGLPTNAPQVVRDPVLLAVVDLHRMRGEQRADDDDRKWCCGPPITQAEIEAQRPLFGSDSELFDYIRAAEAYFVRRQPGEVLQLIPDAARQPRFSYLQFSRQMLRGMALQNLKDRNARGFWLSLFPAAVQPYQREALELALAMHEERSGRLDLVFAPGSQVRHPVIRQLLLEHVAGPDLLRQQASRPDAPRLEREVALYMLLAKELRRGFYREFVSDIRLLPADASGEGYYGGARNYDARWSPTLDRPPLAHFGTAARLGDFGCPAIAATAAQLADTPNAIRPRLCLAEFFRLNHFDEFNNWYGFDEPVKEPGLASTPQLFPAGTPYARLEVYKSIIADPAATADDKALALNRAIRCYAPTGNNSCSGTEVEIAVRRAWFNRLKAQYPQSRWAKDLKFYW